MSQHRRPDIFRAQVFDGDRSLVHKIKPPSDLTYFDQLVISLSCYASLNPLSIFHTPSLFQVLSSFSHVPPLISLNETDGSTDYEGNWNNRLGLQLLVRLVLDGAQGLQGACMLHTWRANGNMTWLKSKLNYFDAPIHIKIDYRAFIIFHKLNNSLVKLEVCS
jgi:hypothetical protein